jgi:N-methylhydantoinase B/oxoprolinase/acetone carboxylase alpha subunit
VSGITNIVGGDNSDEGDGGGFGVGFGGGFGVGDNIGVDGEDGACGEGEKEGNVQLIVVETNKPIVVSTASIRSNL